MTILQTIKAVSAETTNKAAVGEFYKVARLLVQAGGRRSEAEQLAQVTNATERVTQIMKAAVSAGALSSGIADYQNLVSAFYESLRWSGVFDAILPSMTPAPLRSRGTIITTGISGGVIGEGQVKPVSSLTLDSKLVEPKKAAASVVITAELASFSSPSAVALFNSELQKGVVAATDAIFLAELIANTTPTASAGATLANIQVDLGALLDAVITSANSKLFYISTPANAKKLTMKSATSGALAFPNMGPSGGEILPGVTSIVTDQLPANTALLLDASGLAGSAEGFELAASRQASLQMQTTPDSPPTAATSMLHLFQTDHRALRAERYFGFQILRSSAVASLSGVSY